jgi:hypothetical protein
MKPPWAPDWYWADWPGTGGDVKPSNPRALVGSRICGFATTRRAPARIRTLSNTVMVIYSIMIMLLLGFVGVVGAVEQFVRGDLSDNGEEIKR